MTRLKSAVFLGLVALTAASIATAAQPGGGRGGAGGGRGGPGGGRQMGSMFGGGMFGGGMFGGGLNALTLANDPAVLLADEPPGNLDKELSLEIMNLFLQFNQVGVTLLIATHDIELVQAIGRRTLTLKHGHLTNDSGAAA